MNQLAEAPAAAAHALTVSIPGQLEMTLDATPSAIAPVRHIVARHLQLWGDGLDTLTDRALLAVNELLANVCEHTAGDRSGRRSAGLLVQRIPDGICINVRDNDPRQPALLSPEDIDESGRGLLLVRAVADGFGVSPNPTGKDVWVSLIQPPENVESPTR
ncbi:ATP-binding protein [Streptomyces sp. NPDC048479]|uniref:ATP-binding protein n=1 Tax=Streptomyces sp. NPDC048479 TaxID=3154725 RepID=UPI00342D1592